MVQEIVKVKIKPYYAGSYRLEYDGKYVTLLGKDKNYPVRNIMGGSDLIEDYEEMVLVSAVVEKRNITPKIEKISKKFIYITLYPND